jgi:FKBP-type peptidyl-prolyl cis-trans isomerase
MRELNTSEWVAVGIAVIAVLLFFIFFGGSLFSSNTENESANNKSDILGNSDTNNVEQKSADITAPNGGEDNKLVITDIKVGEGAEARAGLQVRVHYTGKLQDGSVFDTSYDRGEPFVFTLGARQVIEGWEKGIEGMRVGGQRMLIIPPEMAYGDRQIGTIPANSTLFFEVELLGVDNK